MKSYGDGWWYNNLNVFNTTELYTDNGEDGESYDVYFTTIKKKGILWRNRGKNQKGIKNRAPSSLDSGQHSPSSFTSWHAWKRTNFYGTWGNWPKVSGTQAPACRPRGSGPCHLQPITTCRLGSSALDWAPRLTLLIIFVLFRKLAHSICLRSKNHSHIGLNTAGQECRI